MAVFGNAVERYRGRGTERRRERLGPGSGGVHVVPEVILLPTKPPPGIFK